MPGGKEVFVAMIKALAFLGCFAAMEGVAWATHRYLMHGPLWILHRSHHRARTGLFEANDLFAVLFAGLAIGLFVLGAQPGGSAVWWGGAGVTAYGVMYALAHDGVAHGRLPVPRLDHLAYVRRLRQAHRLHHATTTRRGAVSFGFLAPRAPRILAKQLRMQRGGG